MPFRYTPTNVDMNRLRILATSIRLYCLGQIMGENIMEIRLGRSFKMGTFIQTPVEETDGALQLGPERARVFTDLLRSKWESISDIRATNIYFKEYQRHLQAHQTTLLIPKTLEQCSSTDNLIESLTNSLALFTQSYKSHLPPNKHNQLRSLLMQGTKLLFKTVRVVVKMSGGCTNANTQGKTISEEQCRGNVLEKQVTNFDDDVDDPPEKDLALNVNHIFEADQCDAFDSDVDEAPNIQTMFMVNLLSEDPIYDMTRIFRLRDIQSMSAINAVKVVNGHIDFELARYRNGRGFMTNHKPAVVHDSEETLEIAELTRKRMYEKMKSPQCIQNKAKDENDRKKVEASVLKPLSTPTVYPPNTPVKLVPRVLPTKSQLKINLYTLTQRFTEVDKTCKKRITPTGLTEGESGFEQTKRCYLTEVIPFFKTLKQHFEGVQMALFKEVKGIEEIFDQMSAEVDQNTVDKQCAEIERKNLLIANENLIANCLSNQLMFAVEQSRCLDLEAEISKLQNENQKDVNDEMIRGFNKLEVEYLNLQLKYQHLQENFRNNKSQTSQDVPEFDSFFRIKILETQLQEKDNAIRNLKAQVSKMNDRSCETYNAKDVTALIEQNECVRVELEKVKQHYKELYDSIKITRVHTREKTSTMLNEIESLKAQLKSKVSCVTSDSVKPKVLAPGMYAIDVKPIPHPLKNNRSAHLNYINHLKESVETVREIVEEARVVKPLDNALNYACQYTKLSQELLEYVIDTCPKRFNERDNKAPSTPITRKKQVTFNDKPGTSSSNTQKHEVHQKVQQTNVPVIHSTGVNTSTEASGSKPRSNTKKNRIMPAKSENKKKVEDHPRTNKSVWTKVNRVDSSRNTVPTATVVNAPIVSINTSVSTTIAQDVPSTSHSLSSSQVHPPVFPQGEPSFCTVNIRDVSLAEPNQVNSTTKIIFSEEGPKITLLNNIVGNPLDNAMSQHYAYAIIRMSGIEKKYYREVLSFLVRIDLLAGHQRSKEASAISINKAEYIAMKDCRPKDNKSNKRPIGKCNRVLERQKKLRNQIFRALTASADVPSSVTETTDTTSTLPPPPPPLQKPTGHRDIWEKVKDQKSRMHH
ncbi:hypothetical protein Tco_0409704 [Tanacetum coccineum]